MTITTKIEFADTAASTAWDKAGYGTMDDETASKVDIDGDGKITETEVSTYKSSQASSTINGSTAEGEDQLAYDVVDIDEAPEGYGEMKSVLNRCIASFDAIAAYISSLVTNKDTMSSQIAKLDSDVDAIKIEDNTGVGASSAYSLTLAGEESDEKSEQESQASLTNKQAAKTIETKNTESLSIAQALNGVYAEINTASNSIQTTGNSVGKIMAKVGDSSYHKNSLFRTIHLASWTNPIHGLEVWGDFFRRKSEKQKVKELCITAQEHEKTSQDTVAGVMDSITPIAEAHTDLSNKIEEKWAKINKLNANKEDENKTTSGITVNASNKEDETVAKKKAIVKFGG